MFLAMEVGEEMRIDYGADLDAAERRVRDARTGTRTLDVCRVRRTARGERQRCRFIFRSYYHAGHVWLYVRREA